MTYEAEDKNGSIRINYEYSDNSFSHEFGTCIRKDAEWTKIEVYIEAIEDWLDVTHTSDERILKKAEQLLERNVR